MRILAKINRGAILFATLLLGVIIYLVVSAQIAAAATPKIQDISRNYVLAESGYHMLPGKYRIPNPTITPDEVEAYIAEMKTAILAFYPEDGQAGQAMVDSLETGIRLQAKGVGVVLQLTKVIDTFGVISVDGNSATVNMNVSTTYNGPGAQTGVMGTTTTTTQVKTSRDVLLLQKIKGEWKVIYSNLNIPTSNTGTVYSGTNPGQVF
jgi:hypothetical protein